MIAADVAVFSLEATPGSLAQPRALVLRAGPGAQSLGGLPVRLLREAPLARGARRLRGLACLGRHQRPADEIGQALFGLATVTLLGALVAGKDEQVALGGKAAAAKSAQARFHFGGERGTGGEVKAQLRRGGELVDVLSARTRAAHEGEREVAVGNLHVGSNRQRHRRAT